MNQKRFFVKVIVVLFIVFTTIMCRKYQIIKIVEDKSLKCWSPIDNWSGLMSDSAMAIENIPEIPIVDSSYIEWVNNDSNRVDIRSLTSENFADLECLKTYLDGKSIVQLGESSHGTREYSRVKVRLIKFLHEEMGFDVLAMESGLFECFYTNDSIQVFYANTAINNSVYSIWYSADLIDLFEYIKSTHNTNRPLILSGFDCQFSSSNNSHLKHKDYLFEAVSKIDNSLANEYKEFESKLFSKIHLPGYLIQNRDSIKQYYMGVIDFLENHKDEIEAFYPENYKITSMLEQTIYSIISNIELFLINNYSLAGDYYSYKLRDSVMAANLIFLKEELYPGKKIITWAHNYHIANSFHPHALYPDVKVMGNWLHDNYSEKMYTIGLYMLRGKTTNEWNWNVIDVQLPVSANSLEAILYQSHKKALFVDLMNQKIEDGNEWMFKQISAKTSGFANESMIVKDVYDGIVFIDQSTHR